MHACAIGHSLRAYICEDQTGTRTDKPHRAGVGQFPARCCVFWANRRRKKRRQKIKEQTCVYIYIYVCMYIYIIYMHIHIYIERERERERCTDIGYRVKWIPMISYLLFCDIYSAHRISTLLLWASWLCAGSSLVGLLILVCLDTACPAANTLHNYIMSCVYV